MTNDTVTLIGFMVLMFIMFYFLIIRPQQKRQKSQQQMLSELKRGDKVITIGGIFGVIEAIDEKSVVIKTESGNLLRLVRGGIAMKQQEEETAQP
ncbi:MULTISPECIES: preprotein translocase subunit YajC [Dehalogenimonas]|jgi:preprotein translocase subunit YajC|uniref:Protein translocase subunit yajC n=2 Tax=Dehalogenimonas TaxID=670486 RepID=A0A0W0GHP1_9CHLR|nr:preprotein translocase subunit YajC [Dehalogenimonas alkenigignens]KTB48068.1 protein translocase subunit yajC [Dehalogenimonas alkenigignens]PVV84321.1 preprotein translocase subunit YajC [Dehalogenimonas alkenigignens]